MEKQLIPKNKFKAGDEVFVCDGGECHGKLATITKVITHITEDILYDPPRYDGKIAGTKQTKFSFEQETDFCFIQKGICELCGSSEGIIKPPYPNKEYGNVHDLARMKFPYFVTCICPDCQRLFDLREEKRNQIVKCRQEFIEAERSRRQKKHLCNDCGGEIDTSGPFMVYEGTYETRHKCKHCGKENCYT